MVCNSSAFRRQEDTRTDERPGQGCTLVQAGFRRGQSRNEQAG